MAERQTTNYVDLAGIENLYVARVSQNTGTTYEVDTPRELAGIASLKKTVESTTEKVYYSNRTAYTINNVSDPVLELTISALDNETLAYITGTPYDKTRKALYGGDSEPVECALLYEYGKINGDKVYCVYYAGTFSYPEVENNTKADAPVHNGMTITFTSTKTQKAFTNGGRVSYTEYEVAGGDLSSAPVKLQDFYTTVLTPDTIQAQTPAEHEI